MQTTHERPLVFFDTETTGTDTEKDRIIQFAALKLSAADAHSFFTPQPVFWSDFTELKLQINPGVPIPKEATDVHGITDDDVCDEPRFDLAVETIEAFFDGADLAGFNITSFDIPILAAEFKRCGRKLELDGRRIVDAMEIFYRMMPRTLEGAYRFYCGKELEGAHDAMNDVRATMAVLGAQLQRYDDLPCGIDGLSVWCRGDKVTLDGKVAFNADGDACLTFGKHKGTPLRYANRRYLGWMLDQSFPDETKAVIRDAMYGKFPKRKGA